MKFRILLVVIVVAVVTTIGTHTIISISSSLTRLPQSAQVDTAASSQPLTKFFSLQLEQIKYRNIQQIWCGVIFQPSIPRGKHVCHIYKGVGDITTIDKFPGGSHFSPEFLGAMEIKTNPPTIDVYNKNEWLQQTEEYRSQFQKEIYMLLEIFDKMEKREKK